MKTNFKLIAVGILTAATTFLGCKKEELKPLSSFTPVDQGPVKDDQLANKNDLKNTTWHITSFNNLGKDETELYRKNYFGFYANAELIVMEGNDAMEKGQWYYKMSTPKTLSLLLPQQSRFVAFSAEWTILKQTNTSLLLEVKKKDGICRLQLDRIVMPVGK